MDINKESDHYKRRKVKKRKISKRKVGYLIVIIFLICGIISISLRNNMNKEKENMTTESSENKKKVKYPKVEENGQIILEDFNVYGESLNLKTNGNYKGNYIFVNEKSNEQINIQTGDKIDQGIKPSDIKEGEYKIYTPDYKKIISEKPINIEYYSITRENKNYLISFFTNESSEVIYKKEEAKLPDNVYDIVIDPGHGGNDGGSEGIDGYTLEKDINLIVSELIYEELTNMGYKVKLTRNADYNPGMDDETCEVVSSYCFGGRVTQVYDYDAKIVISIHHNTGGSSGFEVYSSIYSSDELAKLIISNLEQISIVSSKETGYVSPGLYNDYYEKNGILYDYMYMIRETGASATGGGDSDGNYDNAGSKVGAEGILIELGYIDNYNDLIFVTDENNQINEAKEISLAIDSYIKG